MNDKFNSMDFTDSNGIRRYGYYGAYTDNPYLLLINMIIETNLIVIRSNNSRLEN
jgi:hypothetical protein